MSETPNPPALAALCPNCGSGNISTRAGQFARQPSAKYDYCDDCQAMSGPGGFSRRAPVSAPAGEVGELGGSVFPRPPGIMRCGQCGHNPHRSLRCGFLLVPDLGEGIGEQRCECIQCEADTAFPGYDDLIPAYVKAQAALTAQAAALEGAEGRAVQMEARWEATEEAHDRAVAALLALGCRMGPGGWERPCDPRTCRNCSRGYQGQQVRECCWLPIIPAPGAAGEEKKG